MGVGDEVVSAIDGLFVGLAGILDDGHPILMWLCLDLCGTVVQYLYMRAQVGLGWVGLECGVQDRMGMYLDSIQALVCS